VYGGVGLGLGEVRTEMGRGECMMRNEMKWGRGKVT
jgi:hypothetical protein